MTVFKGMEDLGLSKKERYLAITALVLLLVFIVSLVAVVVNVWPQ